MFMKEEGSIVILNRVKITDALFIEKIALLDPGYILVDGRLPKDHYGVYYRAGLDCHNQGIQYISDWSGTGLTSLDEVAKLFVYDTGK